MAASEQIQKIEFGFQRNSRPATREATIPANDPPKRECEYSNPLAKLAR